MQRDLAWLQADLATVSGFLMSLRQEQNPMEWYQFSARKQELEAAIAEFAAAAPQDADVEVEGFVFMLPEDQRFDITEDQAGRQLLYQGAVDGDLFRTQDFAAADIVGKRWRVRLQRREVDQPMSQGSCYALVGLVQAV